LVLAQSAFDKVRKKLVSCYFALLQPICEHCHPKTQLLNPRLLNVAMFIMSGHHFRTNRDLGELHNTMDIKKESSGVGESVSNVMLYG
jgi:hypothetical protein